MLHGVADLLRAILFIPDPFRRLLRRCAAIRSPLWNISTVRAVRRTSTSAPTKRCANARSRAETDRQGAPDRRNHDSGVGEIIPESWATSSGISTLDSATELAEIYSRLSGARRPLIDASGPEACSPNEESASDHCDRDVPDIALRYNRNALPVTSCDEVQVCRESGTIRGGADMAAIGTPLKGPTDSPARLAPGAREPRAIADDIAAQLKPVAVARASQ